MCVSDPSPDTLPGAEPYLETRYCNEDEENDPCEEFEEILSCTACGDIGTLNTILDGPTMTISASLT